MEYQRFGSRYFIRIDPQEEMIAQLRAFCEAERIDLAAISGLGAAEEFTVGLYDLNDKKFYSHTYRGAYEITSVIGTVTTMNGEFYAHLHMNAADRENHVVGGHLTACRISATCELVAEVSDGTVERTPDPATGLNLFSFPTK